MRVRKDEFQRLDELSTISPVYLAITISRSDGHLPGSGPDRPDASGAVSHLSPEICGDGETAN